MPNMVWYNYRRVPAVSLHQADGRRAAGSARSSTTARNSCRTGPSRPDVPQGGAGTWRLDVDAAGSGVTGDLLAHCIDTRALDQRLDRQPHRDDRDVRQAAQARADRQGAGGRHRRRGGGAVAASTTARSARSNRPATRAATRRSTRWRSTASTAPSPGTCTTSTACNGSTTASKGALRGWSSILVTDGDHPYLGNWWVPGLIIGYEHSFVHQVADFLEGLKTGKPAAPTFRDALETNHVCDAIIASGRSGKWTKVASKVGGDRPGCAPARVKLFSAQAGDSKGWEDSDLRNLRGFRCRRARREGGGRRSSRTVRRLIEGGITPSRGLMRQARASQDQVAGHDPPAWR